MKITKSNFYLIIITALAAFIIVALYFVSKKGDCCGECHIHPAHMIEQTNDNK
jgi:hypothetical protein